METANLPTFFSVPHEVLRARAGTKPRSRVHPQFWKNVSPPITLSRNGLQRFIHFFDFQRNFLTSVRTLVTRSPSPVTLATPHSYQIARRTVPISASILKALDHVSFPSYTFYNFQNPIFRCTEGYQPRKNSIDSVQLRPQHTS